MSTLGTVVKGQNLDFGSAINVGAPSDVYQIQRDSSGDKISIPHSNISRGLALKSLRVTSAWDRLWNILGKQKQIYFLTVAFDISEQKPVIFPPKEIPAGAVYKVQPGKTISFTLGNGIPVFPARPITGGLVTYITVCEADRGIRHIGEVMTAVHQDLNKDDSVVKVITKFVKSPAKAAVNDIYSAAIGALQPIATILKNNQDDYVALFSGIYPAKGPWEGKLTAVSSGTTIELGELR